MLSDMRLAGTAAVEGTAGAASFVMSFVTGGAAAPLDNATADAPKAPCDTEATTAGCKTGLVARVGAVVWLCWLPGGETVTGAGFRANQASTAARASDEARNRAM